MFWHTNGRNHWKSKFNFEFNTLLWQSGNLNLFAFFLFLQVFHVSPINGQLRPGEQQLVTIYFYGNDYVSGEAFVLCRVEEGPIYEMKLRGETSSISYSIDSTIVDLGLQVYMCLYVMCTIARASHWDSLIGCTDVLCHCQKDSKLSKESVTDFLCHCDTC